MKKIFIACLFVFNYARAIDIKNFRPIPFEESMKKSYAYNTLHASKSKNWQILRKQFTDCFIEKPEFSESVIIPKKIHQIWLGSPVPVRYKKLQESWKKFHTDWEYVLWTDNDVKNFKMRNIAAFNKAKNYGQKSDIWRYEILERFGGLYIDLDFECFKSFDVLHHMCEFYIGAAHDRNALVYNGLIGSVAHHPILQKCINSLELNGSLTDVDNIMANTGPDYITKIFIEMAPNLGSKTTVLPVTYFYPFPNNQRDYKNNKNLVKKYIRPESFCIHYWDCSWVK